MSTEIDKSTAAAITKLGGPSAAGRALGISSQAVGQWRRVPSERVLQVERLTGVSRHDLRPDIYGPKPDQSEAAA